MYPTSLKYSSKKPRPIEKKESKLEETSQSLTSSIKQVNQQEDQRKIQVAPNKGTELSLTNFVDNLKKELKTSATTTLLIVLSILLLFTFLMTFYLLLQNNTLLSNQSIQKSVSLQLDQRVNFIQSLVEILSKNITGIEGSIKDQLNYWMMNHQVVEQVNEWKQQVVNIQEEITKFQRLFDAESMHKAFQPSTVRLELDSIDESHWMFWTVIISGIGLSYYFKSIINRWVTSKLSGVETIKKKNE